MLPKMIDKCFLTPELAPIFSPKEDDSTQFIGLMTTVLDEHGLMTDSGVHGQRGYNSDMMFTWIGAAVDIPPKVHKLMNNLGPKIYFIRIPPQKRTHEQYLTALMNNDFNQRRANIKSLVIDYLEWLEHACPIMEHDDILNGSLTKMPWIPTPTTSDYDDIIDSKLYKDQKKAFDYIVRLGILLAHLRGITVTWNTEDTQGSNYGYAFPRKEEPDRAMQQLVNLAKGHALLTGRNYVTTKDDLPLIIKVVLSSAPLERVTIFDVLLNHNGKLTVNEITKALGVSEPTARRTTTELKALGLVDMDMIECKCSDDITRELLQIKLKDEFSWFISDEFKKLREGFTPSTEEEREAMKEKNP